jgi:tetratricopeptide (TPR) repeat protein
LLSRNALEDFQPALQQAETLVAKHKDFDALQLLGGLRFRAGRPQEAMKDLQDADAARQADYDPVHAEFLLALAHHKLRQPVEALRWYEKGRAWMKEHQSHRERWGWLIWLELDVLCREAAAVVRTGP